MPHKQFITSKPKLSIIQLPDQGMTKVEDAYRDKDHCTKMSILNCAKSGKFSTNRTIGEYNRDIWKLKPQPVKHK